MRLLTCGMLKTCTVTSLSRGIKHHPFGCSLSQAARHWHGTDDHCGFTGCDARFVCRPEERKSTVQSLFSSANLMDVSDFVSGRAMVRCRIEMLPLMHTVDRKVIPAEEEGAGNVEEEHFVDDDVAQAPKAPKDSSWHGEKMR